MYNGLVLIVVGFDMGWSKRSSGRRYDSQSRHCYLIGKQTCKIIACVVFCKVCRVCQAAERKNKKVKQHTCMKNYEGASKSMESDAILRMCIKAPDNVYYIGTIISDDDKHMRAHLKHAATSNKGKLTVSNKLFYLFHITTLTIYLFIIYVHKDNIPEPQFLADPSHRIKVIGKHFYALAAKPMSQSKVKNEHAKRMKKYWTYMINQQKETPTEDIE